MARGKGKITVKDVDRGLAALLKRIGKSAKLKVGVFGDNAAREAQDGHGATVGDIASTHEWGGGSVPERSWLRRTVTNDLDRINRGVERAAEAVLSGKTDAAQAVDLLGHGIVGMVKGTILSNVPPELSPEYAKVKERKYPGRGTLVASSQFLGSVTHAVEVKARK